MEGVGLFFLCFVCIHFTIGILIHIEWGVGGVPTSFTREAALLRGTSPEP